MCYGFICRTREPRVCVNLEAPFLYDCVLPSRRPCKHMAIRQSFKAALPCLFLVDLLYAGYALSASYIATATARTIADNPQQRR